MKLLANAAPLWLCWRRRRLLFSRTVAVAMPLLQVVPLRRVSLHPLRRERLHNLNEPTDTVQ